MVDVDDPVGKTRDKFGRKNLHIAREDDEIHVELFEKGDLTAFGFGLATLAGLNMVERDAVEIGEGPCPGMIADNQGDLAGQFAGLVAVQQVGVAVKILRNEYRHAYDGGGKFQTPVHAQSRRDRLKMRAESIDGETFERPFHPHEKQAGLMVLMLIGMNDVGPMFIEHARNRCYQTFTVRAIDQQDGGVIHARELSMAFYCTGIRGPASVARRAPASYTVNVYV